jgi:transposase-like protein
VKPSDFPGIIADNFRRFDGMWALMHKSLKTSDSQENRSNDMTQKWPYPKRHQWQCKGCGYRFSATSGTIFADHKLPIRDYLLAIALFVNGAKGHNALQLSRDLNCHYKSAYVLAHKIREAVVATDSSLRAHPMFSLDKKTA